MAADGSKSGRPDAGSDGPAARGLRRLMLAIVLLAAGGTFADLLFLDHHGDFWQMIPLGLLGGAAAVILWHATLGGAASVWGLRIMMLLLICGGVAGFALHFQTSAGFHTEMDSSLQGWPLLLAVLQSKAPPTLAPAMLVHMGLVGLAVTYRHPALRRRDAEGESKCE